MKIRTNYVSNSSSSSFVINCFDKELVSVLMKSFIDGFDFNDTKLYSNKNLKRDLEKCFEKKLNSSEEEQRNNHVIYVKYNFWNFFDNVFDYFICCRDFELSGCETCEYYKTDFHSGKSENCLGCANIFLFRRKENIDEEVKKFKNKFKDFDFDKKIEEIKKLVYSSPVKETKIGLVTETNWSEWESFSSKLSEEFFQQWKNQNPDSFIIPFASDIGSQAETFMRGVIYQFVHYMNENGVNGFKGENS